MAKPGRPVKVFSSLSQGMGRVNEFIRHCFGGLAQSHRNWGDGTANRAATRRGQCKRPPRRGAALQNQGPLDQGGSARGLTLGLHGFGGEGLERLGAATLAARPGHHDWGRLGGGDCGFQPTAIFFHGGSLAAQGFGALALQARCRRNAAGMGSEYGIFRKMQPNGETLGQAAQPVDFRRKSALQGRIVSIPSGNAPRFCRNHNRMQEMRRP